MHCHKIAEISPGTTATHEFEIPGTLQYMDFSEVFITYRQGGKVILEKSSDQIQRDGVILTAELSQEDTLAFAHNRGMVDVQVRIKDIAGNAYVSESLRATVSTTIKEGAI